MRLLNFLPEIYVLVLLFLTLILNNFKVLSYRSLSLLIAVTTAVGLGFFLARPDLAYFASPISILLSDSLSFFGKILSLMALIVFSLGFHFHRELNYQSKQSSNLFLLFFALFAIGLFQANHLVFFMGCALGVYISSTNLILIESNRDAGWVSFFRQRSLPIGLWVVLVGILFALGTFLFGSVYLSEWVLTISKHNVSDIGLFVIGLLILLVTAIPLAGLRYQGKAPLGIAVSCYSIFLVVTALWLRLGVPFFSISGLLTPNLAQVLLSVGLGLFALRYAWNTLRTRDHHRWYAAALPTNVALSLFLVLLNGEYALPAFYAISLSLLFTFALVSHSFLDHEYKHKGLLIVSLVALIGAPPLIMGEQFYRLVHNSVYAGNLVAGSLMMIAWFAFTVAGTQMIGKILLLRNGLQARRKIEKSEIFFLGIYLICVITLTAFRPSIVSLLNEHPPLNLW